MKMRKVLVFALLTAMLMTLVLSMAGAEEAALLKNSDIVIRDPFIITWEGKYYMYGTEGETAFSGAMDKFQVYVSTDLQNWEGPYVIFQNDGTFWANQQYWAPAMHVVDGTFYFYGSMGGNTRAEKGIQLFTSDNPLGPFVPASDAPLTGEDYEAIDPEIYVENGKTYMLFSKDVESIYCAELSEDLDEIVGDIVKLFDVSGCGWAQPAFGNNILNDGAALLKTEDGRLVCFFSTTGPTGYNMGYAVSDNGSLFGNWECTTARMLVGGDGGHNMFFTNLEGDVMTAYHTPNFPAYPAFKYVEIAQSGEIFFVD